MDYGPCVQARAARAAANGRSRAGYENGDSEDPCAGRGCLALEEFAAEILEEVNGVSDVCFLSIAILGDFAFDGEWSVVADIEESLEVAFHTDVTVSEWDFLAP
jgi:hypothetical protein